MILLNIRYGLKFGFDFQYLFKNKSDKIKFLKTKHHRIHYIYNILFSF